MPHNPGKQHLKGSSFLCQEEAAYRIKMPHQKPLFRSADLSFDNGAAVVGTIDFYVISAAGIYAKAPENPGDKRACIEVDFCIITYISELGILPFIRYYFIVSYDCGGCGMTKENAL
jgi:hypothetical protein